jgi:Domain of unknown function DUF11
MGGVMRALGLLVFTVTLAATGCMGITANPSYFPFYLPPGDVVPTHAKPAGQGYFNDFDPKAQKIEVTPTQTSAATGSDVVLIATVYDRDGQPRRSRRVEWILEGPGEILEVDESGYFAGRGYIQNNQRAVSYTSYREHRFDRGTAKPQDDFTIMPGQTFCILRAAKPGETIVTALAPEIYNSDARTVTTRITWTDSQFQFPEPRISRSVGGEIELKTQLSNTKSGNPLAVRYRIVDGVPAVFIPPNSTASASTSYSGGVTELDVPTGTTGEAGVKLAQPHPQGGITRVAMEVIHADGNVANPVVLARRETSIEWAAGKLALSLQTSATAAFNKEHTFTLETTNPGGAPTGPLTMRLTLPSDLEFVKSEPPYAVQNGRELIWQSGTLGVKAQQAVRVTVRPMKKGETTLLATAETQDGLQADARAALRVGTAEVKILVEGPDVSFTGEKIPLVVVVENPGAASAENLTAWMTLPPNLEHTSGQNPVDIAIGTLKPGEKKRIDTSLTAKVPGRLFANFNLTGDGGLTETAKIGLDVKTRTASDPKPVETPAPKAKLPPPPKAVNAEPVLILEALDFTPTVNEGDCVRVRITVRNPTTTDATDIAVSLTTSPEAKPYRAMGPDKKTATIDGQVIQFDKLPRLKPGETAVFQALLDGTTPGQARLSASVTSGAGTQPPIRDEQVLQVVGK